MPKRGSVLSRFMENALREEKYPNLHLCNKQLSIFGLEHVRQSKCMTTKDYFAIYKDYFKLKNPYKKLPKDMGKGMLNAALNNKKGEHIRLLTKVKMVNGNWLYVYQFIGIHGRCDTSSSGYSSACSSGSDSCAIPNVKSFDVDMKDLKNICGDEQDGKNVDADVHNAYANTDTQNEKNVYVDVQNNENLSPDVLDAEKVYADMHDRENIYTDVQDNGNICTDMQNMENGHDNTVMQNGGNGYADMQDKGIICTDMQNVENGYDNIDIKNGGNVYADLQDEGNIFTDMQNGRNIYTDMANGGNVYADMQDEGNICTDMQNVENGRDNIDMRNGRNVYTDMANGENVYADLRDKGNICVNMQNVENVDDSMMDVGEVMSVENVYTDHTQDVENNAYSIQNMENIDANDMENTKNVDGMQNVEDIDADNVKNGDADIMQNMEVDMPDCVLDMILEHYEKLEKNLPKFDFLDEIFPPESEVAQNILQKSLCNSELEPNSGSNEDMVPQTTLEKEHGSDDTSIFSPNLGVEPVEEEQALEETPNFQIGDEGKAAGNQFKVEIFRDNASDGAKTLTVGNLSTKDQVTFQSECKAPLEDPVFLHILQLFGRA